MRAISYNDSLADGLYSFSEEKSVKLSLTKNSKCSINFAGMKAYKNLGGNSGITHYENDEEYIAVKFIGEPRVYYYTLLRISKYHIERMKALAESGSGLATYINQNPEVRNNAVTK